MDTLEAIFNRRSIRQYSAEKVTDDQLETILKAAMYAPSAVNKQPWHFIVFRELATIQQIIDTHPNASMLLQSSAAILVCWDDQLQYDVGYGPVDCATASQNMLLAAHSMGIGAVWVGIYPRQQRMDSISKIFNLPGHIHGFSVISLGYPNEKRTTPDRFNKNRIHRERW